MNSAERLRICDDFVIALIFFSNNHFKGTETWEVIPAHTMATRFCKKYCILWFRNIAFHFSLSCTHTHLRMFDFHQLVLRVPSNAYAVLANIISTARGAPKTAAMNTLSHKTLFAADSNVKDLKITPSSSWKCKKKLFWLKQTRYDSVKLRFSRNISLLFHSFSLITVLIKPIIP